MSAEDAIYREAVSRALVSPRTPSPRTPLLAVYELDNEIAREQAADLTIRNEDHAVGHRRISTLPPCGAVSVAAPSFEQKTWRP